jgi:type VI secretion system ImpM family protein
MFGKSPCEGDFVRHDLRDPIAIDCFRWIADSVSRHPIWPRKIPTEGLRFLYGSASDSERVLIGTMIRSRDRVGRDFPLVGAIQFPSRDIGRVFPALPLAWSTVLDKVGIALNHFASLETSTSIASCLSEIAPLSIRDCQDMYGRAVAELEERVTSEFHARVFPGAPSASYYAYHTVRIAAVQFDRPSAPTLLCPITNGLDAMAWLELLRRLLPREPRPLGMLWTSGENARLAVSLSDMPMTALPMIVGGMMESSRIWPLSTSNDAASTRARSLIEPLMPAPNSTLMTTIGALADRSYT